MAAKSIVPEELLPGKKSSLDMIVESFSYIRPSRNNIGLTAVAALLSIILTALCFTSDASAASTDSVNTTILSAQLALLGIVLTVYSIMYAILNSKLITILTKADEDLSPLVTRLLYFESSLFLYFVAAFSAICIECLSPLVSSLCVQVDDRLFSIAFSISFLYIWFQFRVLLEFKSIIFNTVEFVRFYICMISAQDSLSD